MCLLEGCAVCCLLREFTCGFMAFGGADNTAIVVVLQQLLAVGWGVHISPAFLLDTERDLPDKVADSRVRQ